MVTAPLHHCLINMIVLEIMVSVIYLCSITDLVIVHGVDSYPVWGSQEFQNLFPLIQEKKIASCWHKVPLTSLGQHNVSAYLEPLCCKGKISLVASGAYWGLVGYFELAVFCFFFFFPECLQVLMEHTSQQCHFVFGPYFLAELNLVGLLEGQSFPPEDLFMGKEKSPWYSWEPAYGMKIRLNFTASVLVPSQGVVERKDWRCWPDFRVSSTLRFPMKTWVGRLDVYFGSSG